jgi:hypothetical protein
MNKSASKVILLASALALASPFLFTALRADDTSPGGAPALDSSAPAAGAVIGPGADAPAAKKKKKKRKKKVQAQAGADGTGSAPADAAAVPAGDSSK